MLSCWASGYRLDAGAGAGAGAGSRYLRKQVQDHGECPKILDVPPVPPSLRTSAQNQSSDDRTDERDERLEVGVRSGCMQQSSLSSSAAPCISFRCLNNTNGKDSATVEGYCTEVGANSASFPSGDERCSTLGISLAPC